VIGSFSWFFVPLASILCYRKLASGLQEIWINGFNGLVGKGGRLKVEGCRFWRRRVTRLESEKGYKGGLMSEA
jgi:hypothetical protein